jgi:hypothetical protein
VRCAIQIVGCSPSISPKERKRHLGRAVKEMDTDAGTFTTCEYLREAKMFHSPGEAMRAWKKKLPDGNLNELAMKWSAQVITVV